MCPQYFASSQLCARSHNERNAARSSKRHSRADLPGASEIFADVPAGRMTAKVVSVLRNRKAQWPKAANNRVKAIGNVFAWAMENPAIGHRHD